MKIKCNGFFPHCLLGLMNKLDVLKIQGVHSLYYMVADTNLNFQNVGPHNNAAYGLECSRFTGDISIISATNEVIPQCEKH